MGNPAEFIQACVEGRIWVFCKKCQEARDLNSVKRIDTIGHPSYWGDEPWWHDTQVFNCPVCNSEQQSTIHLQEDTSQPPSFESDVKG
ncbi:MAG: hypothetical protein C0624_07415 [Desulfuromonas sp.]|nr:MAG: hypothetical protein C0624_07415 [Desulfuromonas sp.]